MIGNPNSSQTALPVYLQISELLIRDIEAGRLMDGERLPPERKMARDLGTSIGTLRKALAILVKKQLLEQIQGSGNYIRHGGQNDSVYRMFRLELPGGGGLPKADLLDATVMTKPDSIPEFGQSDTASRIRRLRYLNETIIAVEEIWLDSSVGVVKEKLISDSLYHYYQKHLGFWISRAEDYVSTGFVPDWAPEKFPRPAGYPIGFIERFSWSSAPEPVEFSRTWFDGSVARYVQRLK